MLESCQALSSLGLQGPVLVPLPGSSHTLSQASETFLSLFWFSTCSAHIGHYWNGIHLVLFVYWLIGGGGFSKSTIDLFDSECLNSPWKAS